MVRPFDHGAIVTSELFGAAAHLRASPPPSAAFKNCATRQPRRTNPAIQGSGHDDHRSTPRGMHVAMASSPAAGHRQYAPPAAGPRRDGEGAATKYASSGSAQHGYSPPSDKNSEVYSDWSPTRSKRASATVGEDAATPGFRLYDGLTRADGDDDKENRYDDVTMTVATKRRRRTSRASPPRRVAPAVRRGPLRRPLRRRCGSTRAVGSVTRRTRRRERRRGRRLGTSLCFARRANRRRNTRAASGGTRSTTTTVTTTVTTRVRGEPPGRRGHGGGGGGDARDGVVCGARGAGGQSLAS